MRDSIPFRLMLRNKQSRASGSSCVIQDIIESAFSIVERVCSNVKRWHPGDQRERWVGSGLLVAEKQFRRVQGHKQIPNLLRELELLVPSKPDVVKRRKAS